MSGKWKGGRDVAKMAVAMQKDFGKVKLRVYDELEQSIEIGGGALQDALEAAVTSTGIRRVELNEKYAREGGVTSSSTAGRHLTGNMISSVSYGQAEVSKSRRQGLFGWFSGVYEDYFRLQDKGGEAEDGGMVPAAGAMPYAAKIAQRAMRSRLLALGFRRR